MFLRQLEKDLKPADDWDISAVGSTMTVKFKNTDYVKANDNKKKVYTLTLTTTGISITNTTMEANS